MDTTERKKLEDENKELIFLLKVAYADLVFAAPYFDNYQDIANTAALIKDKLTKIKK